MNLDNAATPINPDIDYDIDLQQEYEESQAKAALEAADKAAEELENWEAEHERLKQRSPYLPADSLKNLFARPKPLVKHYIPDLIFAGSITILAGDPKAGKTTFLLHALGALTQGKDFLGNKLDRHTVLYASEQTEYPFRDQAEKVPTLYDNEQFRVILYEDNVRRVAGTRFNDKTQQNETVERLLPPSTWDEQIVFWKEAIQKNKAGVFVIDTLTAFSNFRSGEAFDPGVVQVRLQLLKTLLTDNAQLSIVILHHLRKENNNRGGDVAARSFADIANSYALRAGTDQNILIYRPSKKHETVRTLKIEGRFSMEHEFQVSLDLKKQEFVRLDKPVEDENVQKPQEIIL
jgi:RecA-family ATPase